MAKKNRQSIKQILKSRIGKYLAVFLISAWMFVLGVLVGRGTAPVRFDLGSLDAELASLKAEEQRRQLARVKIDPQKAGSKTDFEFYEELKKSQKQPELKDRKPVEKPKSTPDKPPLKVVKKSTDKAAVNKPVKPSKSEAAKKIKKSTATKKAQKAPAAPNDNQTGSLTVQAASLKDPQDADDLVDRLKKKGYPAYKTIAVVPEQGIWFRVRVGWYNSREEADGTLQRLKKDGFDPFLIKSSD